MRTSSEGGDLMDVMFTTRPKAWARQQGYYPLVVECSPKNEEGKAFYESLGMKAVSIVYQMEID